MTAEQNQALAVGCLRLAGAAKDALGWLNDNEKLVGAGRTGLERALKRHVVEAKRLAAAASRPMSAAVFGPSQAGKSFLIGKFITPPGKPTKVVFEDEHLDFLSQVNPQGGKETTGLVTRFSTAVSPTPRNFPVVLRLLREVDVVKILANSFLFDLSGAYAESSGSGPLWISGKLDPLEARMDPREVPGFTMEDVLELREYVEERLPAHRCSQLKDVAEAYWPRLERMLPRLRPADRVEALSILWGEFHEFNELFLELKAALDLLAHSEEVYAEMDSIRDTANGVLHVDRIYELSLTSGPGAQMIRLSLASGALVTLKKSVVTALTSELRVTLDSSPWPFLAHTDLLDFPGARSREGSSAEKYLRRPFKAGAEKPPREYCFLRGKVAVLFDNYVADLDLNAMMLCVPDSNLEVRTLPELVDGWVHRTHGKTPQERAARMTSLLFCMTKCDRLFDLAAGAGLDQQIENRFRTNFDEFPGWTREWHPGLPFTNTFMLRNPKAIEQHSVFQYDGPPAERVVRDEAALTQDFEGRMLPALQSAMRSNETARTQVSDLDAKVQALMALNDGGVSHLAKALSPICDPNLKRQQIQPRATALSSALRSLLSPYFDEEDVKERVERRGRRAMDSFRAMVSSGRNPPLGLVINELGVDEATLRAAYFEFARSDGRDRAGAGGSRQVVQNDFGIDLDAIFEDTPAAPPPKERAPETFGDVAVGHWVDGLLRRATAGDVPRRLGLNGEQFQVFVDELRAGASRLQLAGVIGEHADRVLNFRQSVTATAAAVAVGASLRINDFVADVGRQLMTRDADPEQAQRAGAAFTRPVQLGLGELPNLPEQMQDVALLRRQFATEWTKAFLVFVRENASSSGGRLVDPEQNARLGVILAACAL